MSTSAEAGATPHTRTPQRGHSFHLSNPVHAALQLLTDVLANIPGPHRARIQPLHKHSSTQSPALISSSSGSGRGEPSTAVLSSEKNAKGSQAAATLTKEEVGTATWMLLHGVAAQYPDNPSRQQKKDVKQLVDSLTRIYPCGECAEHFEEIVRHNPPAVNDRESLEQWTCRVHNVVNRSIGKPTFNCDFVKGRWGPIDCGEGSSCDLRRSQ